MLMLPGKKVFPLVPAAFTSAATDIHPSDMLFVQENVFAEPIAGVGLYWLAPSNAPDPEFEFTFHAFVLLGDDKAAFVASRYALSRIQDPEVAGVMETLVVALVPEFVAVWPIGELVFTL